MLPKSKQSSRAGEGCSEQVILLIHSITLARWMGKEKVMEPKNNLMKNRKVVSTATYLKDKHKHVTFGSSPITTVLCVLSDVAAVHIKSIAYRYVSDSTFHECANNQHVLKIMWYTKLALLFYHCVASYN